MSSFGKEGLINAQMLNDACFIRSDCKKDAVSSAGPLHITLYEKNKLLFLLGH